MTGPDPAMATSVLDIATAHTELSASIHLVRDRVIGLSDAVEIAVQTGQSAPHEAPVLNNLRARLSAVCSPLHDLETALRNAQTVLTPYAQVAVRLEEDQRRAEAMAQALTEQMQALQAEEQQLEAVRAEVEQRYGAAVAADCVRPPVPQLSKGGAAEQDVARLRASLQEALSDSRLSAQASEIAQGELVRTQQELEGLRQEADQLRGENGRMKDDARRFVRQSERRSDQCAYKRHKAASTAPILLAWR